MVKVEYPKVIRKGMVDKNASQFDFRDEGSLKELSNENEIRANKKMIYGGYYRP